MAVRIAFFTGLRLGEVLALRVRDVDLVRMMITVDGKIEEARARRARARLVPEELALTAYVLDRPGSA